MAACGLGRGRQVQLVYHTSTSRASFASIVKLEFEVRLAHVHPHSDPGSNHIHNVIHSKQKRELVLCAKSQTQDI